MSYTHRDTFTVPCPQCKAAIGKRCVPAHRRYEYDPRYYVHKTRCVAYEIYMEGMPLKADRTITLRFDVPAYRTDKLLVADVDADVDAVVTILGKYGAVTAA